jgi:hypothetical protein
MIPAKIGTAFSFPMGPFVSSTDGYTIMSALAIGTTNIRLCKNGTTTWLSKSTATTPAYVELGFFNVTFTTTDLETQGHTRVGVAMTSAGGALPVWEDFWVSETSELAVALSTAGKNNLTTSIWAEALASHTTAGAAGKKLSDLAMSTDMVSALTASSAIQAKTTNLPATPASSTSFLAWSMSTDMATALTNITAIQAKTTNLPATPASSTSFLTWAMSTDLATALTNITAIQAKTTNLPATPASSTSFVSWAMSTDMATALTNITAIQAKTTNLPATPASSTDAMRLASTAIDLIWDEEIVAAHATTNTAGERLTAAGAAGAGADPWATATTNAAYTSTQFGGRLDALVSSRASSTQILTWSLSTDMATALTNIAAIQAKTTTLPASPASSTGFTGLMTSTGSTSIADGVWDAISESTQSYAQQIRNMRATLAGEATGGGTASISFRDVADTINRLTFTATTDGNRTAVVIVTT